MSCDSMRCMLIEGVEQAKKRGNPLGRDEIVSLKRCINSLERGQMPNVIELMSILSQVTRYVDVGLYL